jgi:hypothetical protein
MTHGVWYLHWGLHLTAASLQHGCVVTNSMRHLLTCGKHQHLTGPHRSRSEDSPMLYCSAAALCVRARRLRLRAASNRGSKNDGGLGNFDEKLQGRCSCRRARFPCAL